MKDKILNLQFHGKILDQLGYQAYQSPVASIAEMVANAWDADAENVDICIPDGTSGRITIKDDGNGMTFEECQEEYLNIGYDKRRGNPLAQTPRKQRNIMGRKGIGKFACFGIARIIRVETVSGSTGERTVFEMDIDSLRCEKYLVSGGRIDAKTTGPADNMKGRHGTEITLTGLMMSRKIDRRFSPSLARRFLIHQTAGDFRVTVNGTPIPQSMDMSNIEFSFPKDYPAKRRPGGLEIRDGWGVERVEGCNHDVMWRVGFQKEPINDAEIQGITVFANGKLAHKAFFFDLSGALPGQHGQGYMFGQVVADFLDQQKVDVMSTERQRVNWDLAETQKLLEWGQERTKQLLRLWGELRSQKKLDGLKDQFSEFRERLGRFESRDRRTVERVLVKLAQASSLTEKQYKILADSFLTAFEGGRLKGLWDEIEGSDSISEERLLGLLVETDIIAALNVAEAIKTKLAAIGELKCRISKKQLEDTIRDHIARNPWMIEPDLELFRKETRVTTLIKKAADKSGLAGEDYKGRIDLVLSNGTDLVVMEFMRPGLVLNQDHVTRCEQYVYTIRADTDVMSKFKSVTGRIVADEVARDPVMILRLKSLAKNGIHVCDWGTLLDNAKSSWGDYLEILVKRGGSDGRLTVLLDD